MRVRYSAIMDQSVCDYCRELDGIVCSVDSGVYKRYDTPAHYLCRCIWLPITRDEVTNVLIAGTDITTGPSGRSLTIDDIVQGRAFEADGESRKVGGLIDLRTFSDDGNEHAHYMMLPIHIYKKD